MDSRILVGTPATLSAVFYDGGEAAVDPGTVTVTITRSDGTAIATAAATTGSGAAARTYALPAQTRLDHLTAVWTGAAGRTVTTYHEVTGGHYAELAEIRAMNALADATKFPTATLEAARDMAEDRFEEATGVSWVPRHARDTLSGNGETVLALGHYPPRSLIGVSIDGVVSADLTKFRLYPYGVIERTVGSTWPAEAYGGGGNLIVEYVHYWSVRPPADLKRAFLMYVRYLLLEGLSRIPDRATAMTTEFGTFTLASSTSRATLLPEIDNVLADYDKRIPGMAAV